MLLGLVRVGIDHDKKGTWQRIMMKEKGTAKCTLGLLAIIIIGFSEMIMNFIMK